LLRASDKNVHVEAHEIGISEKHTSEIVQFVAIRNHLALSSSIPQGWTPAEIGGLEPLLRINPGEVLINFMSSFIVRFLNDEATNMDEILGPDYREIRSA
jgi:hypothetical protein